MNTFKTPTLAGTIKPANDKSMTHRALILAALATGETVIVNPLRAADTTQTMHALQMLGVPITIDAQHHCIKVQGIGREGIKAYVEDLATPLHFDFGNSGTTTRLMIGLLAGLNVPATITGDASLQRRPMDRIVDRLTQAGAQITMTRGHLPLTIHRGITNGLIDERLQVGSAQVKTALLLAGLGANVPVTIVDDFQTRDHTEIMLATFGASITVTGTTINLPAQIQLTGQLIAIPGDISSAAFWLVAGAVIPESTVTLANVGVNPTRTGILAVLERMHADVKLRARHQVNGEPVADITVRPTANLQATSITKAEIPQLVDELPIIALLATQAQGTTEISGAQELRFKESDRLATVGQVLTQFGANIQVNDDGFTITGPTRLHVPEAPVDDFGDHRITMLIIIAQLMTGARLETRATTNVNVSYPNFIRDLEELLHV